jgi:hypothetical protein
VQADFWTAFRTVELPGRLQVRRIGKSSEQQRRFEMSEWDNYCDEIGGVCKDMEAQAARIAELEAENERLRKELNLIGTKADFCADECEYGPDATSFRLIADDAKRALKGAGE